MLSLHAGGKACAHNKHPLHHRNAEPAFVCLTHAWAVPYTATDYTREQLTKHPHACHLAAGPLTGMTHPRPLWMPFLRMMWSPSLAAAMAACTERKLVPLLAA